MPAVTDDHRTTRSPDPTHALAAKVKDEVEAARRRVAQARERRAELQRQLDAARAAEAVAQEGLAALESIAGSLPGAHGVDRETGVEILAGRRLRETAIRVAIRRGAHGTPVHWREWHEWLREAGFDAAGKRASGTFLTQLGRSPLVRRSTTEGVYVLEIELLMTLQAGLETLREQLAQLLPPQQMVLLKTVRAQRRSLELEAARVERAIEEAWSILVSEFPGSWPNTNPSPRSVVEAWAKHTAGLVQPRLEADAAAVIAGAQPARTSHTGSSVDE